MESKMVNATSESALKGVRSTQDFIALMNSLIVDIATGKIPANTANAITRAGEIMLRAVEIKLRYGGIGQRSPEPDLSLE